MEKSRFSSLLPPKPLGLASVLGAAALTAGLVIGSSELSPANAASLSFDLNCVVSGNACNDSTVGSFGTITFSDNTSNSSWVDVVVNLVNTSSGDPHKVQQVYLNYDDSKFSNLSLFTTDPLSYGVIVDEDNISAQSYQGLDLQIPDPPPGSLGFEPISFTLKLAGTDLNISDFNFAAGTSSIFAGVHIGNYGGSPGTGGQDSITVGAKQPTQPIPEPASMLGIMAFGALGGGRLLRKKKQQATQG